MSTTNDTYEAGLIAVMHALDALAALADAANTGGRHTGICDALAVVTGMLDDYRKAIA